ncbi:MAG: acyl-CoA thioesterase, partial [Myxococcota bacterium]
MSASLNELVSLLRLEPLGDDRFLGQSQDLGWGQVFGGQVLGQGLSAAVQTVHEARQVHSLQAYFLRPGDAAAPVRYDVDRIRDGGSFTTRRVVATQNEKSIFHLTASFQRIEEGFSHGATMPNVPLPDELPSELELWRRHAERLPPRLQVRVLAERPIELRPVDPVDPFLPTVRPPQHAVWMRA